LKPKSNRNKINFNLFIFLIREVWFPFFMISNQLCNTQIKSHTRISAALLDLLLSYVFKSVEVKSRLTYVERLSRLSRTHTEHSPCHWRQRRGDLCRRAAIHLLN